METTTEEIESLRPASWDTFIGQEDLKTRLAIMIAGAKDRGQQLGHILLSGPPGLGKTTLAQIIANEMGQPMIALTGGNIKNKLSMLEIFMNMQKKAAETGGHCVLFVDEIHAMSRKVSETFYTAMEDFYVDVDLGEGETARVPLPQFTLIGATTHPGAIPKPLKDRMEFMGELSFYDPISLSRVVDGAAEKMNLNISREGAIELAKRGRGTPRVAINLVKNVRDYAAFKKIKSVNAEDVTEAMRIFGIDSLGLTKRERMYLEYLDGEGKQGLSAIAAATGEEEQTLLLQVEPFLLRTRLIRREMKGRVITSQGKAHIKA